MLLLLFSSPSELHLWDGVMPGLQDVLEKFITFQTELQVLREVGGEKKREDAALQDVVEP